VGRSTRRAYAYLLVDPDTELSSVARKRLAALKEFSELGSGFKIAALDLELRGAGNLLGAQQHGQIGAVGFEMYCRLLDETVRELSGEKVEPEVRTNLRLQLDVHIPPEYIADETQRLQTYKRLAGVRTEEERSQAAAELEDRYGPLPQAVVNLTEYSLLKTMAETLRINSVERRVNRLFVHFRDDSKVDARKLMQFVAKTPGVTFAPNGELQWAIGEARGAPLLAMVKSLFKRLAQEAV
jgi:transcription-repair coupling factor (superfamily II helicase)